MIATYSQSICMSPTDKIIIPPPLHFFLDPDKKAEPSVFLGLEKVGHVRASDCQKHYAAAIINSSFGRRLNCRTAGAKREKKFPREQRASYLHTLDFITTTTTSGSGERKSRNSPDQSIPSIRRVLRAKQ